MAIYYVTDDEKVLRIGHQNDNLAETLAFDASKAFADYGTTGTWMLLIRRPGETEADTFAVPPSELTTDASWLYWTISATDVANAGLGEIQRVYTVDNVVKYSARTTIKVCRSLIDSGTVPPYTDVWLQDLTDLAQRAESAASSAQQSADDASTYANSADYDAQAAGQSASDAHADAQAAHQSALDAASDAANAHADALAAAQSAADADAAAQSIIQGEYLKNHKLDYADIRVGADNGNYETSELRVEPTTVGMAVNDGNGGQQGYIYANQGEAVIEAEDSAQMRRMGFYANTNDGAFGAWEDSSDGSQGGFGSQSGATGAWIRNGATGENAEELIEPDKITHTVDDGNGNTGVLEQTKDDVKFNGDSLQQKLVEVTYGTTTFAEVGALLAAGKIPYVVFSDYLCVYLITYPSQYRFSANGDTFTLQVAVGNNDVWGFSMKSLQTTIPASPTDNNFPTSKAVADYAEPKHGNYTQIVSYTFDGTELNKRWDWTGLKYQAVKVFIKTPALGSNEYIIPEIDYVTTGWAQASTGIRYHMVECNIERGMMKTYGASNGNSLSNDMFLKTTIGTNNKLKTEVPDFSLYMYSGINIPSGTEVTIYAAT